MLNGVPYTYQMGIKDPPYPKLTDILEVYKDTISLTPPALVDLELEGEFKHGHVYTRAHNGEQYHDYHPHPLNYYNYLKKIGLPLTDASLDFAEQSMRLIEITTTEEQMFAAFNTIISDRNTKLKSLF